MLPTLDTALPASPCYQFRQKANTLLVHDDPVFVTLLVGENFAAYYNTSQLTGIA